MPVKLPRLAFFGLVIAVGLGAGQAFAADAKKVADALVAAAMADGQTQASYDSATASGDDVTITGFKTSKAEDSMVLPSLVFSGAAPRAKGGFTAQKLTIGATTAAARGETVAWQSIVAENAVVPSPEEVKANAHIAPFSRIDVAGITLSGARFPVPVAIDAFGMSVTSDAEANPTGFATRVSNIRIPPDFFAKNFLASAYLKMLGYNDGFVVNLGVDGGYENATDTLTLQNFTIDTAGVGKLTISGKFSGVSLRKLSAMQVHEVQSAGKLDNFKLRFDNAGIVERLLDMQAKTQDIKREDAIQQATAALGFFMIAIQNEAFANKVVASATTFLNQPKSITISAEPTKPVPFTTLFEVLGAAPETLPDVVGADVTANN